MWGYKKTSSTKKLKISNDDSDNESDTSSINLPFCLQKSPNSYIYSHLNHIYFNNNITQTTAFELNKELRNVETKLKTIAVTLSSDIKPIYLHLTTEGGEIYAAMSIIDCIKSITIPVYTVIDGFVASAGTLISLAGEKRFICKNAYMLIHELRSGFWGKMTSIDEEYSNLKKLMIHITQIYIENTKISKKEIENILKKDISWNAKECISKGLVSEYYK
jgi:ATP-dependent protease ClpP protease subunit